MKPETPWSQNLDQFAHAGEASSHFTPENMFFNFAFYGYFELFVPNDCPHRCASILCNYTEKLSAWSNPISKLQPYQVQKVSNLWLQDFEHYFAFPLFHKHFWACKSRGPPTCSAFSDMLPFSFAIPLNRAELWWGVGCQCALMPCIWLGKERKVSASHLGAEWKKEMLPKDRSKPSLLQNWYF